MNKLIHGLGLAKDIAFQDVFSIDEPELLAFVPRPALALLLIFPVSEVYEKSRHDEDKDKEEYTGSGPEEPVVWYRQTIGNACGLIGLLHAVSNGTARDHIGKFLCLEAKCSRGLLAIQTLAQTWRIS
jgi:ubiquitin carboxyl-terminal hydrolase L3